VLGKRARRVRRGAAGKGPALQAPRHAAYPAPTLEGRLIDLPREAFGPWTTVTERNRGRNEERRICVADTPAEVTFPHCNQVFLLERYTRDDDGNILTAEAVTGITSLTSTKAGPDALLNHNRGHWGIEVLHNIRSPGVRPAAEARSSRFRSSEADDGTLLGATGVVQAATRFVCRVAER